MSHEAALILAVGLVLALAVPAWLASRRPKYLVTVQKVTNANQQPETVTFQANLPASASAEDVWEEAEKLGLAGVARMESINERILAVNKEIAEEIGKRRANLEALRQKFRDKQLRRAARTLGVPVHELTEEMVQRAVNGQPVKAVEAEE